MLKSPKEEVLERLDALGFDRIDPDVRHEWTSWNSFIQNNAFYAVKYIKDRSPSGMMHILAGGKWRWQIRVGQQYSDPKGFTIALWDAKEGVRYSTHVSSHAQKIDTGTPVFMMRTVRPTGKYLSLIEKHVNEFESYALSDDNHCPKCGDMLIPRKAKKLRAEEPYALARATRGKHSLPKQRTYLACNDWPTCTYIQSYVKEKNETV